MEVFRTRGSESPYGTNAIRIYPACAILEYASRRLIFVCAIATTFPRIIVRAASAHRMPVMSTEMEGNAVANTRSSAANPAIFAPEDMNAVTAEGAPWYTSGVHMWNGTAATLKPN